MEEENSNVHSMSSSSVRESQVKANYTRDDEANNSRDDGGGGGGATAAVGISLDLKSEIEQLGLSRLQRLMETYGMKATTEKGRKKMEKSLLALLEAHAELSSHQDDDGGVKNRTSATTTKRRVRLEESADSISCS